MMRTSRNASEIALVLSITARHVSTDHAIRVPLPVGCDKATLQYTAPTRWLRSSFFSI
jgi:hypothetical protein